ncbi:MAG: Rha family transcriptional regulator [Lachnospiraceae bacterium]|nr:Rha family transcriptional regulator [Lachnospiraceae bacterium]
MQKIEKTLSSVEVSEMIEKTHANLMRDLRRYTDQFNQCKIAPVDFFVESTYKDAKGETRPCYEVTKKGCEFIANKLTGIKGTIFTARYINKFHEMESTLLDQQARLISAPTQLELMETITQEYDELRKEIKGIKADIKRIHRNAPDFCGGIYSYKGQVLYMLEEIRESEDAIFLGQIYTLMKKHLQTKYS